jgi:hypothetical protein
MPQPWQFSGSFDKSTQASPQQLPAAPLGRIQVVVSRLADPAQLARAGTQ